jgi:hypothetical protein
VVLRRIKINKITLNLYFSFKSTMSSKFDIFSGRQHPLIELDLEKYSVSKVFPDSDEDTSSKPSIFGKAKDVSDEASEPKQNKRYVDQRKSMAANDLGKSTADL